MKRIVSGILLAIAAMILSCESHDIGEDELKDLGPAEKVKQMGNLIIYHKEG